MLGGGNYELRTMHSVLKFSNLRILDFLTRGEGMSHLPSIENNEFPMRLVRKRLRCESHQGFCHLPTYFQPRRGWRKLCGIFAFLMGLKKGGLKRERESGVGFVGLGRGGGGFGSGKWLGNYSILNLFAAELIDEKSEHQSSFAVSVLIYS